MYMFIRKPAVLVEISSRYSSKKVRHVVRSRSAMYFYRIVPWPLCLQSLIYISASLMVGTGFEIQLGLDLCGVLKLTVIPVNTWVTTKGSWLIWGRLLNRVLSRIYTKMV